MNLRVFYLTRRGLSDGYGKDAFISCRHFLKRELAVSHLPSSLLKMQAERRGCGPLYLIYRVFAKKKTSKYLP